MEEESGRGSGRVGLLVGNRGSGRAVNVSPDRVQEKWPVDNSALNPVTKVVWARLGVCLVANKNCV